ncbi:hypothetical protein LOTGIDRAFT_173474 [Lottia gigantea]|uniref:Uncharacterized protein n=1 Tax=Lottia gigantea TaxID=225164 RepID=V4ARM0_LOTGI|nr:hypothetical protein LOTGIDRAFT_173474 [Lottia gigantea]ESO99872.1 hypothetical protein LOTGIDRAFT_173474 [Lottia gigantea]
MAQALSPERSTRSHFDPLPNRNSTQRQRRLRTLQKVDSALEFINQQLSRTPFHQSSHGRHSSHSTSSSKIAKQKAKVETALASLDYAEKELELEKQQAELAELNTQAVLERRTKNLQSDLTLLNKKKEAAIAKAELDVLYESSSSTKSHRTKLDRKKEDYIIISPTVGSKSQLNDGGRITFEINSLSNWLLLSDAYFRCDFKIKDATQNQVPQTNTTLENNFFPSLFSEMVLEAGSNPIETIKHPGEFDTMLKTVLYPKDFDSVSGWIPDVGSVLKEPVRNLANDADLARVRVVARNTIERVGRSINHRFEKRVLQYKNVVENNRWGNYVNWKLYPLFGLLEHRKVSIGLPYKIASYP